MPLGMPEWDGTKEMAESLTHEYNAVLDALVNAGMWTGDPPYRGVSAAEQVRMLVQRAEAAEKKLHHMTIERDEWQRLAKQERARREYDSVDAYNARISEALRNMTESEAKSRSEVQP